MEFSLLPSAYLEHGPVFKSKVYNFQNGKCDILHKMIQYENAIFQKRSPDRQKDNRHWSCTYTSVRYN